LATIDLVLAMREEAGAIGGNLPDQEEQCLIPF
jgi:hypothetical protein